MILDVFNPDLFFRVKEISVELKDSFYSLVVKDFTGSWTFLVYYIQENAYNNISEHKRFINDFINCFELM